MPARDLLFSKHHSFVAIRLGGADYWLPNARGVAILVRRSLQCRIINQINDEEGRILLIEVEVQGLVVTFGSLYAPTQDKPAEQIKFLDSLEKYLETFSQANIILGGDFNCLLNPSLDRSTTIPPPLQNTSNQYRLRIKAIVEDRRLCDIWRVRRPQEKGFTLFFAN